MRRNLVEEIVHARYEYVKVHDIDDDPYYLIINREDYRQLIIDAFEKVVVTIAFGMNVVVVPEGSIRIVGRPIHEVMKI